jgi:hypothetical protein
LLTVDVEVSAENFYQVIATCLSGNEARGSRKLQEKEKMSAGNFRPHPARDPYQFPSSPPSSDFRSDCLPRFADYSGATTDFVLFASG